MWFEKSGNYFGEKTHMLRVGSTYRNSHYEITEYLAEYFSDSEKRISRYRDKRRGDSLLNSIYSMSIEQISKTEDWAKQNGCPFDKESCEEQTKSNFDKEIEELEKFWDNDNSALPRGCCAVYVSRAAERMLRENYKTLTSRLIAQKVYIKEPELKFDPNLPKYPEDYPKMFEQIKNVYEEAADDNRKRRKTRSYKPSYLSVEIKFPVQDVAYKLYLSSFNMTKYQYYISLREGMERSLAMEKWHKATKVLGDNYDITYKTLQNATKPLERSDGLHKDIPYATMYDISEKCYEALRKQLAEARKEIYQQIGLEVKEVRQPLPERPTDNVESERARFRGNNSSLVRGKGSEHEIGS